MLAVRRAVAAAVLLAGFVVVARVNYASYFHDYRDAYALNAENTSEVARAIRRQGIPRQRTFLVGYPDWLDGRLLGLELGDLDWATTNSIAPGAEIPDPPPTGRALFVLFHEDRPNRRLLARRYPQGRYVAVQTAIPAQGFGLFVLRGR